MRLIVFLLLLVVSFLATHESQGQRDHYITSAELKRSLQAGDTQGIVEALNRAKRSQRSSELMSFLLQLWNASERSPDLPWGVIESPRVRIEIANVLIQASNNGLVNFNRPEARAYSRRVATGSVDEAKTTAILNLGLIGDAGDIDLLKEIAFTENPQTFRAAVISLARMCGPRGEEALAEVRGRVRGSDHRQFVNTPADELVPFRRCPRLGVSRAAGHGLI